MASLSEQLIANENEMAKLFNAGDVDGMLTFFARDFSGFSSTTDAMINSIPALRKTIHHYIDAGDSVKFEPGNIMVLEYDHCAITIFHWKVIILNSGKKTVAEGRASHVYVPLNNEWKIIHEHFSKTH